MNQMKPREKAGWPSGLGISCRSLDGTDSSYAPGIKMSREVGPAPAGIAPPIPPDPSRVKPSASCQRLLLQLSSTPIPSRLQRRLSMCRVILPPDFRSLQDFGSLPVCPFRTELPVSGRSFMPRLLLEFHNRGLQGEAPVIHVSNLTKYYGDYAAIRDVSFEVTKGQVVGFLGPNGAGKSTTMRILAGFQTATSGKATIDGLDVFWKPLEVRKRIGYMPENCPLYPEMRVAEYLHFRAGLK